MSVSTEWLVAVHEAGHAVIGIDERQTITHALLVRDSNGVVVRGETHAPTWPAIACMGDATAEEVVACSRLAREILAGMHAEWQTGSTSRPGASGDIEQLSWLANQMFNDPNKRSRWTLLMNSEIQPLVKGRWKAIIAVARNLLIGEQSRADIEREMRAHPIESV